MATLAERLVEAEQKYHELRTGSAAVEVRDADGTSVRYARADINGLKAYIAELKAAIAAEASGCTPDEGPLRLVIL